MCLWLDVEAHVGNASIRAFAFGLLAAEQNRRCSLWPWAYGPSKPRLPAGMSLPRRSDMAKVVRGKDSAAWARRRFQCRNALRPKGRSWLYRTTARDNTN